MTMSKRQWRAGESTKKHRSPVTTWLQRICLGLLAVLILFGIASYAVAVWYQHRHSSQEQQLGTTFVASYARSLGLEPEETFTAIVDELGVKHLRLVSYWDKIEATHGKYDFSELDWQMEQAAEKGVAVSLALGLRQPRWPECHAPKWVDITKPRETWQPALETFIKTVVNRYKTSPALQSYQLENEYFLQGFGICPDSSRERLVREYQLVKQLDSKHPIIVSRSNNAHGMPVGDPQPDYSALSVYRRTWEHRYLKDYITYPFPSWYYSALLGWSQIFTGHDSIIHELQCEPWAPGGRTIPEISLTEQNKSFDAARFRNTVAFAKQIGTPQIYLWGSEYWYYRATALHDASVWDEAKQILKQ